MRRCDEIDSDRLGVDEEGLDSHTYIDLSISVIVIVLSFSPNMNS